MSRSRKLLAVFLAFFPGVFAAGLALGQSGPTPPPERNLDDPATVSAAVNQTRPLLRIQLRPKQITLLSSQTSGKILDIALVDGQACSKGQVLFTLDCSLPQAQLARVRAVKSRRDNVLAVTARLAELKSRSALEVDVAKAEAAEAAADVRAAEVMVSRCQATAPFDGRVSEVLAKPGQFVTEGQPVMEVLSDRELEVEFVAPSRWIGFLKPGLRFPVVIDETGTTVQAEVSRLGGKVDPVSQSVRIYARLVDQPPGLMAGMSGMARLEAPK